MLITPTQPNYGPLPLSPLSPYSPENPNTPWDSSGPSRAQLLESTRRFLQALSTSTPPLALLTHFSTTSQISILHYPSTCPHPSSSLLLGPNAIRSYFDLLATHWTRSNLSAPHNLIHADPDTRTVTLAGSSIRWTWRANGRSWTEEFTCILGFDEFAKITRFEVRTESEPGTCVMCAVDRDSQEAPTPRPVPLILGPKSTDMKKKSIPTRHT